MEQRQRGITSFTMKLAAIVGMTCNHVANTFAPQIASIGDTGPLILIALYSLGGMTFPIMAFLLNEGYRYTSNIRKYALRLLLFALVAQIPYSLLFGFTANVLFTLLIGLGILYADDAIPSRIVFALILVGGIVISMWCDWGVIGPLMVYLFKILRPRNVWGIILTVLVAFVSIALPSGSLLVSEIVLHTERIIETPTTLDEYTEDMASGFSETRDNRIIAVAEDQVHRIDNLTFALCNLGYACIGFTIAVILMAAYNGNRGRPLKWFFYAYYPLHLFVIYVCFMAIVY